MSNNLTTLRDRVNATQGPDFELGGAIVSQLISVQASDAARWYGSGRCPTASLDEALALVERVLPGFYILIEGPRRFKHPTECKWLAELHGDPNRMGVAEWGATAPLAILSALMSALLPLLSSVKEDDVTSVTLPLQE